MSFYYTKAIRLKKNGRISVTVACNNVRPLNYWTDEYKGTLEDLLVSIQQGNFQLLINKSLRTYNDVMKDIDKLICLRLDKEGLTWDAEYEFRLNDRAKIIRFICGEYAKRLEKDDWSDMRGFEKALNDRLDEMIPEAKAKLEAARQGEIDRGIVSITCAALSIFEDKDGTRYDLLCPKGEDNFVLAPDTDYAGGKLQTSDKVIQLGDESRDMYAFLSFDGLGISMEDYIDNYCSGREVIVRNRFEDVDRVVQRVLDAGVRLIPGK